ncbi:MAG: hypothetical protein ACUVWJ_08540 [Spirochaetota bacterium]
MSRKTLVLLFLLLVFCPTSAKRSALAQQVKKVPELHGKIETTLELERRATEGLWAFDFPLYAELSLQYKSNRVLSMFSFDYYNSPSLGDTYIMGGEGNSILKLGYFRENWGEGYSTSSVDILNKWDSRYPQTIFFQRMRSPNPLFLMSKGDEKVWGEIVLSQTGDFESINDALAGFRAVYSGNGFGLGTGMIRAMGYPPPLFFLTLRRETEVYRVWAEVSFLYLSESPDRWNAILGMRRLLKAASVLAEFSILHSSPILFLEEKVKIRKSVEFSLGIYTYLETFSSAISTSFSVTVDEKTSGEIGGYIFFGKEGSFFSRFEGENYNTIYMKLKYGF